MFNILILGQLEQTAPTVSCGDGSIMPQLYPFLLDSLNLMEKTENLGYTTMPDCEKVHVWAEFCLAEYQLCRIMLSERFNARFLVNLKQAIVECSLPYH